MDANFWQRWLHMHRIAIILEHDMWDATHTHTLLLPHVPWICLWIRVCAWCATNCVSVTCACVFVCVQAGAQTPAHGGQQRALQHHPVSHLPLCAHLAAEGLEQLRSGRGLLLRQAHIQVTTMMTTTTMMMIIMMPPTEPVENFIKMLTVFDDGNYFFLSDASMNQRCHYYSIINSSSPNLIILCAHSSLEQPPTSFYLVRLISKTPCMVLRLGFPIGTPAHVRNKVVAC